MNLTFNLNFLNGLLTRSRIPTVEDIPKIVSDRKLFDKTLYTPLEEAWKELLKRREDKDLEKKVLESLQYNLPKPFLDEPRAVLFRNLITPNHEVRRFVSLVNGFGKIRPLFFEHTQDKFTSNNELKRTLGKLYFAHSKGKKGGTNYDTLSIIDFVDSDGRMLSEVKVKNGQNIIDFHHDFFKKQFKEMDDDFYDASEWLVTKGNSEAYYKHFFTLFIRHGILFENMTLERKEKEYAEKVFLPAFLELYKEFGLKPLIVALEPTDIEGDLFWLCYPGTDKEYVQKSCMIDNK